jgi:hypothetical protein
MKRLALAAVLLSICGTANAAPCAVGGTWNFGSDSTSYMLVPHGGRCSLMVRAGARSTFSSMSVSAPPRHGTARVDGGSRVVYQSKPGYRGEDTFSYTVSGVDSRGPGKTIIRVAVTVQ